jgi:predicted amidohydrolase YtcJ
MSAAGTRPTLEDRSMPAADRRLAATLLAVALALPAAAAPAGGGADLVLVNGRIITVDPRDSIAQGLAVQDGRIVAIGSSAAIRALAGRRTTIVDLHGRTATPGLIDAHAHIADGGRSAVYALELVEARSVAEIVRLVAERVRGLKPGEWLRGDGWDEGKLAERRYVTARDLDAVAPANPVWLEHTSGHYGVANSVALKLAGVTAASADPAAGTIDHGADGAPSGVLKESAQELVVHLIPAWTLEQRRAGILASLALMNREGMTGVKDPAIDPEDWDAYASLGREGRLSAHVCVLFYTAPTLAAAEANVARLAALPRPPATAAGGNLIACGVKIFMDGSGGAPTAWVYDEWHRKSVEIDAGNRGYPALDPELYRAQVRLFHEAGIHVGTHAIGDRAIDWVVDTYAAVLAAKPTQGLRHSIIHANIPSEHAIAEMARLERDYDAAYPESQAPFLWWIGDLYAGTFGPARAQRLNPFHTYTERGIRWGGGSDYQVTPLPARYGLWASVARETLLGTYGRQPFGTSESVDVRTALKSYTVWAARQLFIEGEAGSLERGKSADIAVWDRDPYAVPTAELKDLRCELTLFRGRVVYRAAGSPLSIRGGAGGRPSATAASGT